MKKKIGVLLVIGIAGLVAAVSAARPATKDGSLQGSVGPGFSISLTQNGTRVTNLAPGAYTITVDDKASIHNFHLTGPGVDEATDIDGMGTTTWNVTLQNGQYTYLCDAHATTMVGKFTVGAAPPTTTTTSAGGGTAAPLTAHAALKAVHRSLTATGTASRTAKITVTLLHGGKKVASKSGTGTKVVLAYKAKAPGKYVAKIVAKAGGAPVSASAAISVN